MTAKPFPKECYLMVYDALKAIEPSAEITAFVKSRRRFRTDMLFLTKTPFDHQRQLIPFSLKLQEKISQARVKPKGNCVQIQLFESYDLMLGCGMQGVTAESINASQDEHVREQSRLSLGANEAAFMEALSQTLENVAQECYAWSKKKVVGEITEVPPVLYWRAHLYYARETSGPEGLMAMGERIKRTFVPTFGIAPLTNPYCFEEDLNSLRSVWELIASLSTDSELSSLILNKKKVSRNGDDSKAFLR